MPLGWTVVLARQGTDCDLGRYLSSCRYDTTGTNRAEQSIVRLKASPHLVVSVHFPDLQLAVQGRSDRDSGGAPSARLCDTGRQPDTDRSTDD